MAKGLLVEFYIDAVQVKAASEAEGRPMFEDREFVKIIPIGDNKTVVNKEVTDQERQRFAEEYAVFKKGVENTFSGTPLTQWPTILPAQIKLFQHFNVYTVDQLADLDDIAINRIGPGTRDLSEKAKAYIAKAKGGAEVERFAAENMAMKEQIAEQGAIIREMSAKLNALHNDPERRGPGRPRKEEQVAA
ncbi:hypothetical protein [Mesorhizobium caraganae]|uniref:hypothetical protein n=1 Tax=Mesorhizobium caraganae TaxID=483206 RepID=UPI0017801CAE|nr:hypothetical protein [Mesorhizobium caraganae]